MDGQTSGSQDAAEILLNALLDDSEENVRAALARLDDFFPSESPVCESERREVLESVGDEVMTHWDDDTFARAEARLACFELLEHIAGCGRALGRASRYLQ